MERQHKTRRGVLTVAGGALVALAGCGSSGGQDGTPTGTPTESDGMEPIDTETPTETEAGTEEPEEPMETETGTAEQTDDEDGTPTGGDAMLRVAHLAPDAPNVDVAVDGSTVLSDVPFETVSDYLSLSTGDHQVTITPTGGTDPVFDQTVTLASGPQTAAAIGEVSSQNQEFTVALLTDDETTAAPGSTRVRAVHTIPDAPAVDVTAGETVIADNISFGEAGDYLTVPSDTGEIELRPDSPANDAEPVATFSIDPTDMAAQTIFATGYLEPSGGQPPAALVVATDAEPNGMTGGTETGTPTGTETGGL